METIYDRLYHAYGPQHWWPADTPFEVMVGAVLTQNTAWSNVDRAITNLKEAKCLAADDIILLPDKQLAELIRPSGYFNIKAKRLKNLCRWFVKQGGFKLLSKKKTDVLRLSLLDINGVGPETADDILLYAFSRPVFVIDIYTRRLLTRLGLITGTEDYETLRGNFEKTLTPDVQLFNEYHALIVRHAKEKCMQPDKCRHCVVEAPLVTSD
ncbi:MAG: endonuclease III domain-containing protein [Gammaproteobacteria bacterium]|nr:endonuclease III domain-containing protein [Gammaproteobacteria bacterium]